MSFEVEATFEDGVLKPANSLPLQEGQKVSITIHGGGSAVERFCGSLRWTRDPAELHQYLSDTDENSWGSCDLR